MEDNKKIVEPIIEDTENKVQIDDRIEWLGMDGFMVVFYFAIALVIFLSFKFRIDFLTAWVFPTILLVIVLIVTINYARTLGGFIRMQNKKIKEGKKDE